MGTFPAWAYFSIIGINVLGVILNEITRRRLHKTRALLDIALKACEIAYDNAVQVSVDTANEAERRRRP